MPDSGILNLFAERLDLLLIIIVIFGVFWFLRTERKENHSTHGKIWEGINKNSGATHEVVLAVNNVASSIEKNCEVHRIESNANFRMMQEELKDLQGVVKDGFRDMESKIADASRSKE